MKSSSKGKFNKEIKAIPSIIPDVVFYENSLSSGAKVFYGLVVFLYRDSLKCSASTWYFSKQMGRSTRAIQLYIAELYNKRFITYNIVDGARYITPIFVPDKDTEIASYIPPEVVKDSSLSSSFKIRYGLISYKSANVNGFYEVENVAALANEANCSISTIYRDLKIARKELLATTEYTEISLTIKTFNSYQDTIKKKQTDLKTKSGQDPPKTIKQPEVELTDSQITYLQQLVGL